MTQPQIDPFSEACRLQSDGRWNEAAQAFTGLLAQNPQHSVCHIHLAQCLFNLGELARGKHYFTVAAELDPHSADAFHGLATIINKTEGLRASLPYFEKAAGLAPGDANIQNDFGQALLALNRSVEAKKSFQRALSVNAKHIRALTGLATVIASRDTSLAEKYLRRALQLQPDYPEALLQLGYLFLRAGHAIKALSFFERIPPMLGDTRVLVNAASALALLSRF